MSSPLHQQVFEEHSVEPLGYSAMMNGDYRLFPKKECQQRMEDFHGRSSPIMVLPKLETDFFRGKLRSRRTINSYLYSKDDPTEEDSPVSVIDGALDVINYDYYGEEEYESDDEEDVIIVPVKSDNYVTRRSRYSRGNKRMNELLLDNACALTEALQALQESREGAGDLIYSSGDEESLDEEDIDDDGYDSDEM